MATYDWQERHIIDLVGKEIALETKTYMFTTGLMSQSRAST